MIFITKYVILYIGSNSNLQFYDDLFRENTAMILLFLIKYIRSTLHRQGRDIHLEICQLIIYKSSLQ